MKRINKLLFWLLLSIVCIFDFASCQNIFGTATDSEKVYGDWVCTKDSGFEIRLTLNKNGTYYYEEIASYGKTLYEKKGKFTLSSNSLTLKELDTGDDERYSSFSISMNNSTEDEDVLDLVATFARKYTFKRATPIINNSDNGEKKSVEIKSGIKDGTKDSQIKLDIEGSWNSDSFGRIDIKGDKITLIPNDKPSFELTIADRLGNTLHLDGESGYEVASYFVVNGSLYIVFPNISSDAIVFTPIIFK